MATARQAPVRRRGLASQFLVRTRWGWRRIERMLPGWLRRSLPWGSSLLFHVVALFVMAVAIRFASDGSGSKVPQIEPALGQLLDDVTSLKDSDQAGDSFSDLKSDEPPSMPSDLSKIDETIVGVAEMSESIALGPELNPTPGSEGGSLAPAAELAEGGEGPVIADADTEGYGPGAPRASTPMRGRSKSGRARLTRVGGGSRQSEQAVERGLDWIARHQRADGGWSLDTNVACVPPGCPERKAMNSDVAATGLALLPLLGAGQTHTAKGRYQLTVRRGLAWLMSVQRPDGMIFTAENGNGQRSDGNAGMYSHCIGTMALCEAYAMTGDRTLRGPAQLAVLFLVRSQHALGGWRYQPLQEGDTSVFGWAVFALRSANLAGITIPKPTQRGAMAYLDAASADEAKATYAYQPGGGMTPVMTAEGLVCRQLLGWPRENPALLQGVEIVARDLESNQARNMYYWYYATQLLHNMRDKNWPKWNEKIRETLISAQVRGLGCDRGSWDPGAPTEDQWGKQAGRLFTTSLSLLTLEVYYRYLPLYKDQGGAIEGGDTPADPAAPAPADDKPAPAAGPDAKDAAPADDKPAPAPDTKDAAPAAPAERKDEAAAGDLPAAP